MHAYQSSFPVWTYLRVTPERVQSYAADNIYLGSKDIFRDEIYGRNLNSELLMKWSETYFEPVSSGEERRLEKAKPSQSPNYDDLRAWSKRTGILNVTRMKLVKLVCRYKYSSITTWFRLQRSCFPPIVPA
jgi:hypothetical protein